MEGNTTNMPIIQQPVQENSQSNMCKAALQEAMEKCNTEQQPQQMPMMEPEQQPPMMPEQQPPMMPEQPPMMPEQPQQPQQMPEQQPQQMPEQQPQQMPEQQPQQMDTPMTEQVMEGFQSEMALPKPSPTMVNNLMNALLMMCLFYLLSHKETISFVMKNLKGVRGANVQVLMTLVFGVCYLFLKRYL
jgi:hypothetical protein